MYIAICDDDVELLSHLKKELYSYCNKYNIESVIDTFTTGEKFLNSKIIYDIIILDYKMGKLNGLETAKYIRKRVNNSSCIIFLTSFPEVAIPAYSVDTYRFVVKSQSFDGLYKALDDFRTAKRQNYTIEIKSDTDVINISTSDIVFLEAQNKFVTIHTADGTVYSTRNKLSALYKQLPSSHFFKIHKSYIINFDFILHQHKKELKLKCFDMTLPISQNYIGLFEKSYLAYLRQQ